MFMVVPIHTKFFLNMYILAFLHNQTRDYFGFLTAITGTTLKEGNSIASCNEASLVEVAWNSLRFEWNHRPESSCCVTQAMRITLKTI